MFQDHRPSKKPLLTFKPSLRRRTKAPQKRYTVTRRVPQTRTTSSLCLMPLPTSSSPTTYEDVASTEEDAGERRGPIGLTEMSYVALGGGMLWDTSDWKSYFDQFLKLFGWSGQLWKFARVLGRGKTQNLREFVVILAQELSFLQVHHCMILVDWRRLLLLLVEEMCVWVCVCVRWKVFLVAWPPNRGVSPLTFMKFNVIITVSNFIAIALIFRQRHFYDHHHHQCWCCCVVLTCLLKHGYCSSSSSSSSLPWLLNSSSS